MMEDFFEIEPMVSCSKWECVVLGFGTNNPIIYRPMHGIVPNWFHRKMQELCFGVKWRKIR